MKINIPKKLLDRAIIYLKKIKEINSVFVFGSVLEKTWKHSKDVDIALLLKKGKTLEDILVHNTILADIFNKEVDLLILNNCDAISSYEARKKGAIIIDNNINYRAIFEMHAFKDYLDQVKRDKIYYKYAG